MLRAVPLVLAAVLLFMPRASADEDETPAGTIELEAVIAGVGVGFVSGSGTLTFEGTAYPFTVSGLSLGDLGVSKTSVQGAVYGLTKAEDFPGTYSGMGSGVTVAAGRGMVELRNQNGVIVRLFGHGRGLNVAFGPTGAKFEFQHEPKPYRMR
jgi:hypothetical protein